MADQDVIDYVANPDGTVSTRVIKHKIYSGADADARTKERVAILQNESIIRQKLIDNNKWFRDYLKLSSPAPEQRAEWEQRCTKNIVLQNRLLLQDFSGLD